MPESEVREGVVESRGSTPNDGSTPNNAWEDAQDQAADGPEASEGRASEARSEAEPSEGGRPDLVRPGTAASEARSEAEPSEGGRPDLVRPGTAGLSSFDPDAPELDDARPLREDNLFDEPRFEAQEARLIARERWNDLVDLYRFASEHSPSPEIGRQMLLSAGLLCLERLDDPRRAEPYLLRVLATDPENIEALDACRQIGLKLGRFEEVANYLDRLIAVSVPQASVDLLVELSEVAHRRLKQVERAVDALHRAYEVDPNRLDILDKARTIFVSEERWEDAKRVLDDVAAIILNGRAALLREEHDGEGGKEEGASTGAEANERSSEETSASASANAEFSVGPNGSTTAKTDETSNSSDGIAAHLAAGSATFDPEIITAEVALPLAVESARTVSAVAEAYRRLGVRLLRNATKHGLARECLERARTLGDGEALSKLDELAHVQREWEARAASFRDEGFEARDKRKAAQLYLRAAELYHVYGQDPIRTDEYVERCLILCPGYAPALRFIEGVYLEKNRPEDLIKRLNGMAATVKDQSVKVQILLKIAELRERDIVRRTEARDSASSGNGNQSGNGNEQSLSEDAGNAGNAGPLQDVVNAYRRALAIQPGNRDAAFRATALLAEVGMQSERAQILEGLLGAVTEEYLRIELHLELGRTYAEQLGNSERARAHFEAVLVHNSMHFDAASALRALYKDGNDLPQLLSVLKVLVEYCPDLESRLMVFRELVRVAEGVSKEEYFSALRQTFELAPNEPDVSSTLEALAEELGRYQALASTYAAAASGRTGQSAAGLWAAAAKIYDEHLPRPADAIRAYRTALGLDPENKTIHDALERLLRQHDDPRALIEVLRTQLGRNQDPDRDVLLRAKIGEVLAQELGDVNGAIAKFLEVLERSPDNPAALVPLSDLYRRKEDWEALVGVLAKREVLADTSSERANLRFERAKVLDEELEQREAAADLYLEVLVMAPEHAEAIKKLSSLFKEGLSVLKIARALEPVFSSRGRYVEQMEMLVELLRGELDPKERAALAKRASEIAEQRQQDRMAALDYVAIAVEADPSNEECRDNLLRIAQDVGQQARAAEVLLRALDLSRDTPPLAATIAASLGDLYEGALSDRSKAIEFFMQAVRTDGSYAPAVAALERLLGAEERYPELAQLLLERMESSQDRNAKIQLGLSLAMIRDEHLKDLEGAIAAYREVLSVEPKESNALLRLADALERLERHKELVGVLDRLRAASDDVELQAATEARAGDVLRVRLGEEVQALERYRRALELSPTLSQAVRGLEALLLVPAVASSSAALLAPYYERESRWRDLAIALEHQLPGESSPEIRKQLLIRISEIHEECLGQTDFAFDALLRAFREGLLADAERPNLTRLALKANRAEVWADALEEATQTSSEPEPAILRDLARLLDGPAADQTRARATWERLLDVAPQDEEALTALERLHASGDDPVALAEVLLARSEAGTSLDERVAFLKRASGIFEEAVENLERATEAMERAAALDPKERSTWQDLERLHLLAGRKDKACEVLAREVELVEEPLSKAALFEKLAALEVELGRSSSAVEHLKAALSLVPDHQAARRGLEGLLSSEDAAASAALALEPLYRAAGDWVHLIEAYEVLVRASANPQEKVERLVAIRSIYEERLGQADRAFQAAARAFSEAPDSDVLLAAIERLGRVSGRVQDLVAVLQDQADALPYVSEERHHLRVRIAKITESMLRDRVRAVEAWRQVLEERPESLIALKALEHHHHKSGELRELAEVLRKMAGLLESSSERVERLRQAAFILEEKLLDRAAASRVYEQILTLMPGDKGALGRLDAIYGESRAYDELARVITEQIAHTQGQERAALSVRLGLLRRMHLEDPRGALAAFGDALVMGVEGRNATSAGPGQAEPIGPPPQGSTPAADAALSAIEDLVTKLKSARPDIVAEAALLAEPHFAARGEALKVVAMKEARIGAAEAASTRRALLQEIAQVYERDLEQPEMAFVALTRAYAEWPSDVVLIDELERLAKVAETEEELADLFAQALPSIESPDLALRLARKTAHIYDHQLGRRDQAVIFYDRVLSLVPDDASALTALERLHRKSGDAAALVAVYRGMLALAEDDAHRKVLWFQIARALEEDIKDLDGAFDAYSAILAITPDEPQALRGLGALCEQMDKVEDLARVLEREASLAKTPEESAQIWLRLAVLRKDRQDDPLGAVDAYGRALELRPDDAGAIAGLSAVGREYPMARARASAALAPIYLQSGAFEEYAACLEAQASDIRESDRKKELFERISEVYEQRLGRPELALAYAQRALHEDPSDVLARVRLEKIAQEGGLLEDLAAFYLDEVDVITDHDLALSLRRRVAEIYDENLKDVRRAIAEYTKILEASPGDQDALKALERLYREAGSFGPLADVYRRRIAQTEDPVERVVLMREFARIQADELSDAAGATATLRRLLEIKPDDVESLSRLAKLCATQGRSTELADVLERLVAAAEVGSKIWLDACFNLGRVKEQKLGDIAGGDLQYQKVLEAEPRHAKTREHLEERLQDAVADDDAHLVQSTSELLTHALRKSEEWAQLISVLRLWAGTVKSGFERVPLNLEIARVYRDHLKQPEIAFTTLIQVFQDAPGMSDVRDELEVLGRELLFFDELVEAFEQGLKAVVDGQAALEIERKIASMLESQVADRERALDAWQRVLRREPKDEEALAALDRLAVALGRWGALADVLERRAELAVEDAQKLELYVRLGSVWDECLSEKDEAISAYRRALTIKPDDRDALLALSRLLDPEEAPNDLYAVLSKLVDASEDERELVRLLPRVGDLLGKQLGKGREAIEVWRRVLSLDQRHVAAHRALENLLEQEGRWAELAEHLEKELAEARDEKEMVRIQRRLGLVKGTRLGSIDEAVRSWSEILKRNPNDLEAHNALRQIYREGKRYEDLVVTLKKLIPLQPDAAGVKAIRFELAEIYLEELKQKDEAIESAKRVLDVEPHTVPELMRLEELFEQTGAYGESVKVKSERVELADSADQKIDILFEIASVYETKIRRKAGATAAYEKILSLEPTSGKAYEALAAIYESNGDYRKLVELHNRRLDVIEEPSARRDLLLSIIEIQERWLGQPELAFTAAVRAFSEEGAEQKAQDIAERLAEETDNWEILADVIEEQIGHVGVSRAIELRKRLGEIARDKLEDESRAEKQFRRVLERRPEDASTREALVAMLEKQNRFSDVVELLHEQVEQVDRSGQAETNESTDLNHQVGQPSALEEKKPLFLRIAAIQERHLGDSEAAINSIKRVLELAPDDQGALSELIRLYRASSKWHPLLNALNRRLELTSEPSERVEIRFEIATVWEKGVEDLEHAIEAYRDVLEVSAGHGPSLGALERLYTQAQRWTDLVEVYERQTSLTEDASRAIDYLTRMASIQEEHFHDFEAAAETYIRVLEADPEHLPAVKSLERVWKEAGDHERLIEAHQRHIELAEDPADVVELHKAIGDLYQKELGQIAKAEEAYKAALDIDSDFRDAVNALADLYEHGGRWSEALAALEHEAALVTEANASAEVHYRIGKIQRERLMNREAARKAFERAVDVLPSHTLSLRAFSEICAEEEDWSEVVRLTSAEAEHTASSEARAELYYRAGEVALDSLDDAKTGAELFDKALVANAQHVGALRLLSDLCFSDENWERSEDLLSRLVDQLDRHNDQIELSRHYYRLAYVAEKVGEDKQSLERYLASYEFDSTYLPTLEGLGAALLRAQRWEDAQRIFQTILIHHRAALTDAEVVDLHYQLGELANKLGQPDRAKKSFEKALGLDDQHAATLGAYAELAESGGDWEEAYDLRERLIAQLEGEEKTLELIKQAKLCEEKIGEPYRAIDAYSGARKLKKDSPEILRALVRLFGETHQGQHTVEVLKELEQIVATPAEKRDVFLQLADVHLKELNQPNEAVDMLNKALDLEPTFIKAFERVEQILWNQKDWKGLVDNYHRMLKRLPKDQVKARIILWRSLGDIYRKVLKDDASAVTAYDVVLKLDPGVTEVALTLAEICRKRAQTLPRAIELYHGLVATAEDPAVPARQLFELYYDALGDQDRAFCSLGALVLMRASKPEEQKGYEILLGQAPAGPSRSLTDNLWRTHVLHPDCRNSLADILSLLYRGAPDLFGERQKDYRVRKERVDLAEKDKTARARLRYFDIWRRLANAMAVPDMDHYHRPGSTMAPKLYPGERPILFAGEEHECFRAMPPRQIAWTLARQMAAARPELAPVQALSPTEVGAAIEAAILLFAPKGSGVDIGLDAGTIQEWVRNLKRFLPDNALKALQDPVRLCIERRELRHLAKFLEGAEHSASRAALLMAGDVSAAERGLSESDQLVDMAFRKRVRGLMLFALSHEHFELRQRLGIALPSKAIAGART